MTALIEPELHTLIDKLLDEQQRLSAVERFAQKHERHVLPTQARYYRDLIPLTAPAPGQQYAFAVDLDACTGCKACVSACHSLNGLDEEEIWRNVGFIHGGTEDAPYQQTVTTACHHCVDPACLNGCPVDAYDKDKVTGIVRHLDDQCIGCQYCVLKCPYDVPKYSPKKGIVRKCDLCSNRLAVGEAPACVQACPTSAIRIDIVEQSEIVRATQPGDTVIAGAFDSSYTLPTTRYLSRRKMPVNLQPANARNLHVEHGHPPLVGMLVLSQMAVGAFALQLPLMALLPPRLSDPFAQMHSLSALITGLLAIGVSILHLGRPLYAWRAFIGLRHSWLSREIVIFGAFINAALCFAVLCQPFAIHLLHQQLGFGENIVGRLQLFLGLATVGSGLAGVACSVKIYEDTQRIFWSLPRTGGKFFGSLAVLGLATLIFTTSTVSGLELAPRLTAALLVIATAGKLLWEAATFLHLRSVEWTPMRRTALTMVRPLAAVTVARFGLSLVGGIILPLVILLAGARPWLALLTLGLCLLGELAERYLFFAAVVAPKMPEGIAA